MFGVFLKDQDLVMIWKHTSVLGHRQSISFSTAFKALSAGSCKS